MTDASVHGSERRGAVPRRRRTLALAAPLVALALAGAACHASEPRWDTWQLPGRGRVVTLTRTDAGLLVGRYDDTASTRTSMLLADAAGAVRPVPVAAGSRYAREAHLVSVSARQGDVVAFGGAPGGAHSNTRWTVWRGTTAGLAEQPQEFETFGGWRAGDLVASAISAHGPVILGSWSRTSGSSLDVGVWVPHGAEWVQPPDPGTALDATTTTIPSVRGVAALSEGYLAVGELIVLSRGIHVEPMAWYASGPAGPWQWVPLPSTRSPADAVEAVSVGCSPARCLVAGRAGGDVLAWTVTTPARAIPHAENPVAVASAAVGADTPAMAVVAGDADGWVAYAGTDTTAVVHVAEEADDTASRLPGRLTAMATDARGRIVVATTQGVWRRNTE